MQLQENIDAQNQVDAEDSEDVNMSDRCNFTLAKYLYNCKIDNASK